MLDKRRRRVARLKHTRPRGRVGKHLLPLGGCPGTTGWGGRLAALSPRLLLLGLRGLLAGYGMRFLLPSLSLPLCHTKLTHAGLHRLDPLLEPRFALLLLNFLELLEKTWGIRGWEFLRWWQGVWVLFGQGLVGLEVRL